MTPDVLNKLTLGTGIVGCATAVWSIFSAYLEHVALTITGQNGARKITTMTSMATSAFNLAAQGVVVTTGLSLVLNNNQSIIGLIGWPVASVMISLSSLMAQVRRRRHREIARAEHTKAELTASLAGRELTRSTDVELLQSAKKE